MAKKKSRKILVFSIIILALAGLGALAFFRKREVIITVQTEKSARRNLTELVLANGRIQPVVQVKISPEVSGEITELPVKEGQKVRKGELLVKIKPDTYQANRRSAEAGFQAAMAGWSQAKASLEKAELENRRNEGLFKAKLVSESAYLEFKTNFELAKAGADSARQQVEVARASLSRADEDLAKTTIYSPIDGTISKLNSERGERVVGTAMMTGTEIMIVADLTQMEARVDIGEIDVVLIKTGQHARLEVDAFRDRKFNGTVTEIANSSKGSGAPGQSSGGGQGQDATRFEVRVRVEEKELFLPGMSVTAEIETRSRTNVMTIPIQSVTTRMPSTNGPAGLKTPTNAVTAAEAKPGSANGKTEKKGEGPKPIEVVFLVEGDHVKVVPVKRGISDDNYVEILEGLKEGDEVISGGYKAINRELEDGKKIKKGVVEVELEKKT